MKNGRLSSLFYSVEELGQFIATGSIHYAVQRIVLGVARKLDGRWFNWLIRPRVDGEVVDADEFADLVTSFNLCEALNLRTAGDAFHWLQQQPPRTHLKLPVICPNIAESSLFSRFDSLMVRYRLSPQRICFE